MSASSRAPLNTREVAASPQQTSQDLLRAVDLAPLVRVDEVRHRLDLGVVLVRLRLLAVERVDLAAREHVREHEVLEHLDPLRRARLVVVLEGLEEVLARAVPLPCTTYSALGVRVTGGGTYARPSTSCRRTP